jgi:hypothetical protein
MRIGFLNIFPLRPHVEYMSYLADRLRKSHTVDVLSCFNDFKSCHYKLVNDNHGVQTCVKCKVGSLAVYQRGNGITRIKDLSVENTNSATFPKKEKTLNSLGNIYRVEDAKVLNQFEGTEVYDKLASAKAKMAKVTRSWVIEKNLDMVVMFNGRMDLMESALAELKAMNIPVYTVESSNTDSGIRIQNGVSSVDHSVFEENLKSVIEYPLTRFQSLVAFSFHYNRLIGKNYYEWRVFKNNQGKLPGLNISNRFVLVLPSSMYEFHGLLDNSCGWESPLQGFDVLVNEYRNKGFDILFRFHPNWSQKVGKFGSDAQQLYREYC